MTCNFRLCAFIAAQVWQNNQGQTVSYCDKHSETLTKTGLRLHWTLIPNDRSHDGEADIEERSNILATC